MIKSRVEIILIYIIEKTYKLKKLCDIENDLNIKKIKRKKIKIFNMKLSSKDLKKKKKKLFSYNYVMIIIIK